MSESKQSREPILCVVSTDVDCIIIPNNCCRKCISKKLGLTILKEYTITEEFIRDCKPKIQGKFTQCVCKSDNNKSYKIK